MQRALQYIEKINKNHLKLTSLLLAVVVLWIDVITGKEIKFPLVYVVP